MPGELTVREAYKTWKFIEKIKEEDRRGMSQPCGDGGGAYNFRWMATDSFTEKVVFTLRLEGNKGT